MPAPGAAFAKHLRTAVLDSEVTPFDQIADAMKILGAELNGEGDLDWAGGAYDEMLADNLPWTIILHAGKTAMVHYGFSADMGEVYWHLSQVATSLDLETLTSALAEQNAAKRGDH